MSPAGSAGLHADDTIPEKRYAEASFFVICQAIDSTNRIIAITFPGSNRKYRQNIL